MQSLKALRWKESSPLFLFHREQTPAPRTSMSPKGQTQTIANQGRERRQRNWKNSQEATEQPWRRTLVLPQGTHVTAFLYNLKPPVEWKMSSFFIPDQRKQRSSSRRPPKARLKEPQTFIRLPKTRLKEYSPCTYPNLISNLTLQLLL